MQRDYRPTHEIYLELDRRRSPAEAPDMPEAEKASYRALKDEYHAAIDAEIERS